MVPIPGTTRTRHLEDDVAALEVELTDADRERLEEVFPLGAAAGLRYPEGSMEAVDG